MPHRTFISISARSEVLRINSDHPKNHFGAFFTEKRNPLSRSNVCRLIWNIVLAIIFHRSRPKYLQLWLYLANIIQHSHPYLNRVTVNNYNFRVTMTSPSKMHAAGAIPKGLRITPLGNCPGCCQSFQSRGFVISCSSCEQNYHAHCIAPGTPKANEVTWKAIRFVVAIIRCPTCCYVYTVQWYPYMGNELVVFWARQWRAVR